MHHKLRASSEIPLSPFAEGGTFCGRSVSRLPLCKRGIGGICSGGIHFVKPY